MNTSTTSCMLYKPQPQLSENNTDRKHMMEKICRLAINHLSTHRSILLHVEGPTSPEQPVELAAAVSAMASVVKLKAV